jgi:DNA mismatch endonuclease (patch repair protein)
MAARKPRTHPRWGEPGPLEPIWKTGARSQSEHAAEQDRAAGGRDNRRVLKSDGSEATASVALKHWSKSRRVYAYLRYWEDGRTAVRYIGDVTLGSRDDALRKAWRLAKEKGLLAR